ncbi:MAG: OsmC family protein [Promethearchaeota archaeon]
MVEFRIQLNWKKEDDPYTRKCVVRGEDTPEITCVTPPPFKKGIPGEWSPEHFFVTSVAACFFNTALRIAENSKLKIVDFTVEAIGHISEDEKGGKMFSMIDLMPWLTVSRKSEIKKGTRILKMAEENCLVGNSIKADVILSPVVEFKQ